jgi:hypothetical protein
MHHSTPPAFPAPRLERFIDRMIVFLLALIVAAVPLTLLRPAPANAARACSGSATSYFDGFYYSASAHPGYNYEGVSGYIRVRDAAICTGSGNAGNPSTSWVMIAGSNADHYDWSQVGFIRRGGDTLRWFSQHGWYSGGNNHLTTRFSTLSVIDQIGVQHTFRVLWSASCLCNRAYIDTTLWSSSPFNPFVDAESGWGPTPFSPQFAGETKDLNSDITGQPSVHTAFSALGAQRYSDDVLEPLPCIMTGANSNPSRWGRSSSRCDAFDIWTATP